jgi:glycosyltransferase involved in cell wall biosynthesis
VTPWPPVTILVCAADDAPAVGRTRASVDASDYPGELEILTGPPQDGSPPAAIANRLSAEAAGTYLLILEAGTTLDPHCVRRLIARAGASDEPVIVTANRRGADGRTIAGHAFFSASPEAIDLLPEDRLPTDITGAGTFLIRTSTFHAIGGFDLGLEDSPALGADLAFRAVGSDGHIGRATGAVAFEAVSRSGLRRRPAYRLAVSDRAAAAAMEHPPDRPHRILWIAPHLPEHGRSGVDARHAQMMRALRNAGTELVVYSAHGTHDAATDLELDELGIKRVAQPREERWDLGSSRDLRVADVIGARSWDTIFISHLHMSAGITPIIKRLAEGASTIVDMGTVRFPAAHDEPSTFEAGDPRVTQFLAGLAGADAVVAATDPDRRAVALGDPALPTFTWSALGEDLEPGSGGARDGSLLYVGDLLHHPNAQGIEWWLDLIAAGVETRAGRPVPLRVVGSGSEIYRAIWRHPHKILIAGWQPDLGLEMAGARVLALPLTYTTGTGGRMATALGCGLPVAASAPAAALLPGSLAGLAQVGSSPAEMAEAISALLTDDSHWSSVRERILEAGIPGLRVAQGAQFVDWLTSIDVRDEAGPPPSRRSGSRRGLRRLGRAS